MLRINYRDILRREILDEVEFITIMMFHSLDAVQSFAGENYKTAIVPQKQGNYSNDLISNNNIMNYLTF